MTVESTEKRETVGDDQFISLMAPTVMNSTLIIDCGVHLQRVWIVEATGDVPLCVNTLAVCR